MASGQTSSVRQAIDGEVEFCVTAADMAAYRQLSGDTNPLHDDAGYARQRGFAAPVVYGGLIVAQISRLLGTRLPGPGCVWRSLSLQFRNPLYVGENACLVATIRHANTELGLTELDLTVATATTLVANGQASALLRHVRSGQHA
jgi:3-hydroxybutyryl-CoA dehydratase